MQDKEKPAAEGFQTVRAIFNILKNDEDTQERCEALKSLLNSLSSEVQPLARDSQDGRIVNFAGYLAFTSPFKQEFFKCIVNNCPYTLFHGYEEQLSNGDGVYHESVKTFKSTHGVTLPLTLAIDTRSLQMTTTILASSAIQTNECLPLYNRTMFSIENIIHGIASYYATNTLIEDKILVAMQDTIHKFVQESGRAGDPSIINKLDGKIIPHFKEKTQKTENEVHKNISQKIITFLCSLKFPFQEGKAERELSGRI
ncbi:MAG: hypothetical protein K0R73_287 [Candidatus Midichloriaceae bacterium]|jgi:hypothetical protein|nr:hypothetical protein [Candidatus Midichloriaceae bacterium]